MDQLFLQIEQRIKIINNFHDDHEVAGWIGLKKSNYSRRKKRGSVPYKEISAACKRDSVSYDYVIYGAEDGKKSLHKGSGGVANETEVPLIVKADRVLKSGMIYGAALEQNIEAFYQAVQREKEANGEVRPSKIPGDTGSQLPPPDVASSSSH